MKTRKLSEMFHCLVDLSLDETNPEPKPTCNGLVFRYEKTAWIGSAGDINFKDRFRPIKSKSCTGCEECGYLQDELQERLSEYSNGWDIIICDNPIDGKLYTPSVTNISRDWETGLVDDWDIEFTEYVEPEQPSTEVN